MTLIICDKYRVASAVAKAMKATRKIGYGIHANNEVTVAYINRGFISLTSPCVSAQGQLPHIPVKYKMQVTDKTTDRRLKRLFRQAKEVVFASAEGAEAQARFFNICRHFRVGQPTSRMWLTSLDSEAIRHIFAHRQKGRVLHDLAQSGLVAAGKDMLFEYNFGMILNRWYYDSEPLTIQETIAMAYLGRLMRISRQSEAAKPRYRIRLQNKSGLPLVSAQSWESEADCAYSASAINHGDTVRATMTVEDTTRPALPLQSMLTLQMDAFENLGFMPSQTISAATRLFERGYISSPFTDDTDNGIIILKPMSPTCRNHAERQLYNLIAGRIKATEIQPVERQTAYYSTEIEGVTFRTEWSIDEPKAEYIGTSSQLYTVSDISVISVNESDTVSFGFSTVLHNLYRLCTSLLATIPGTPYCRYTQEWGTALEGLWRKGFISVENGEIRLTSEGQRLLIDMEPYHLDRLLLSASFDPGRVLLGNLKGRKAMSNFEKWLSATIGDMMKFVPKEDEKATNSAKSEDFTEQPEK